MLQRQIARTFDAYNRLDVISQANESMDYDYLSDGTLDKVTDGNNRITDYNYDALKRLTLLTQDFGGSDPTTSYAGIQYDYNNQGKPVLVVDPVGGETTYAYDDFGNLLTQTSSDSGTTTSTYDAAGNRIGKTDAKGQSFGYSYDVLDRLLGIDAPGTDHDISYSYDSCTQGIGSLCSVTYSSSTPVVTDYSYTAFGDVATHQGAAYTYDAAGRVQTLTYPSGSVLTYSYDAAGQVAQLDLSGNGFNVSLASGIGYAPFGAVASLTYGNGLSLSQGYDLAYRHTAATVSGVLSLTGGQYDAVGNLLQRSEDAVLTNFSYDALDRLNTGTGVFGSRDYDYDKNGNRTQLIAGAQTTSYSYESNSNRLDTIDLTDVQTDANGNTIAHGSRSFTYTSHNRLLEVYDNAVLTASYAYNGLGQRVSKLPAGGSETRYRYGTEGELLAETYALGQVLSEYVYLNGTPLAVLDYQQSPAVVYYVHTDFLGAPRAMTDANGTKVWSATYDPFGKATVDSDPDGDLVDVTLNVRFPGQYFDQESGLHYNYFRDYDPSTGRYIESDPIGLEGGLNTYTYVENDPISLFDPLGLQRRSNRGGRLPPSIPEVVAQANVRNIVNRIRQYDPSYNYVTVSRPGSRYSQRDVEYLQDILRQHEQSGMCPGGGTYLLRDPVTGQIMRTGRTNNLTRRQGEHGRDSALSRYEFEIDVRTDSYSQQRGREQIIHELYNPPLNRVRPISPTNPRGPGYIESAQGIE